MPATHNLQREYNAVKLLYQEYRLYKILPGKEYYTIFKDKVTHILWPFYHDYSYLAVQVFSDDFKNALWQSIQQVFEVVINRSFEKDLPSSPGLTQEELLFHTEMERWFDAVVTHLRDEDKKDTKFAMSLQLVAYQDIDFVVQYKYLKDGAYRLHSYCYDLENRPELTYQAIENDPHGDEILYDFYCRSDPFGNTVVNKIQFQNWLDTWDMERFARTIKLLEEKIPAKYMQAFHPGNN